MFSVFFGIFHFFCIFSIFVTDEGNVIYLMAWSRFGQCVKEAFSECHL
jgi:hypothetical protein